MSVPTRSRRTRRTGVALAVGLACIAAPVAAQASTIDLATAQAFVVLAGATVTNTGPSVLNGDLGVSPGTALVGFGLPAVVNGASHSADAVALQAQADLTNAYNVAAGQPVSPANDLTGTDLGNRTLTAGAYRFTSSAQLTGPLTLERGGRPQRAVRVRDHLGADDRVGQLRRAGQRRQPLQRLLAGRQLGDARHHDGLPGQPDGALEHLAQQRGHRDRPRARAQRPGQPDQQRARQLALRHRVGDVVHGLGHRRHGHGRLGHRRPPAPPRAWPRRPTRPPTRTPRRPATAPPRSAARRTRPAPRASAPRSRAS